MKPASAIARLLAVLIVLSQPGFSQPNATQSKPGEQEPAIRISTDLIQVRAVVTDKKGRVVENLGKDDFIVLENGRPQPVTFFAADKIESAMPLLAGSAMPGDKTAPVAPVTPSGRPAETPSRTVVLFVDTVHVNHVRLVRVKEALMKFVDQQMTSQDLVAIVASGGRLGLLGQFTRDKNILRRAINSLSPWTATFNPSYLTPYVAGRVLQGDMQALAYAYEVARFENQQPLNQAPDLLRGGPGAAKLREDARRYVMPYVVAALTQAAYLRRAALSTLDSVVARLSELPGQRLIFLFSEGFTQMGVGGSVEADDVIPIVSRAVRSGVVIYSLDIKGLEPVMMTADNPIFIHGPYRDTFMNESVREGLDGVRTLALDTGGEPILNTNNFEERIQKVLDQNRVSYVLAYYPPEDPKEKDSKKLRKITVQVKGHPEYIVRAQKGYRPSDIEKTKIAKEKLTPRQKLFVAMNSPLPTTIFGIAATADYLEREGDDLQVAVQLYIDGDAPQYKEANGAQVCELEVAVAVHDQNGKSVKVVTDALNFALKPEQAAAAKQNGYHYYKRLGLKPGLYQIRVGVREPQTERLGATSFWIEVPDLTRGKLQMSSLLFGPYPLAKESDTMVEGGTRPLQPRVAQGIKVYRRGDTLEYNFIVYPASANDSPAETTVQVEILQGERAVFQGTPASLESRLAARDKKGIAVAGELAMNNVPPGLYELRVTVRNPKSKQIARQTTTFSVER